MPTDKNDPLKYKPVEQWIEDVVNKEDARSETPAEPVKAEEPAPVAAEPEKVEEPAKAEPEVPAEPEKKEEPAPVAAEPEKKEEPAPAVPEKTEEPKSEPAPAAAEPYPNWCAWQAGSVAGILLASQIPESWGIGFAGTLALLAVAIPLTINTAALAGVVVASITAVAAAGLPYRLGLLLAVILGMTAAMIVDTFLDKEKA